MSFDLEYYENDSFWNTKNIQIKDIERIMQTADAVPSDVKSIVDVGCGNGIFVNYLKNKGKKIKLMGIDRSLAALKYVETLKKVGDITKIPEKTNSYDLSCALEVIEHLSLSDFDKALFELARVSRKYVLISVPNKEVLKYNFVECPKCLSQFSISLHKRSFTQDYVNDLFKKYGFKNKKTLLIGEKKEYFLISPLVYFLGSCFRKKKSKYPYICPVCGYKNEVSKRKGGTDKSGKKSGVKSIIVKCLNLLWPKYTKYRWILALYEKK